MSALLICMTNTFFLCSILYLIINILYHARPRAPNFSCAPACVFVKLTFAPLRRFALLASSTASGCAQARWLVMVAFAPLRPFAVLCVSRQKNTVVLNTFCVCASYLYDEYFFSAQYYTLLLISFTTPAQRRRTCRRRRARGGDAQA